MRELSESIRRFSRHNHTVLIAGERGSGKELAARAIHTLGPRASRPFLVYTCRSHTMTDQESDLFGYARGAFPRAISTSPGLLETARGGTLFLDDVDEMPLDVQGKLLQTLQEREFQAVGGARPVKLAARILAGASRSVDSAVRAGTFRRDLYHRLTLVTLRVPSLREHKSDIPVLVNHFLQKYRVAGRPQPSISDEAMRLLQSHNWPGNVRQLEKCIRRALASGAGPVLRCADLAGDLMAGNSLPARAQEVAPLVDAGLSATETIPLAEVEKQAILRAILVSRGDKVLAARRLGIGKTTVYRKLKEYGVTS